jgi:2,6-dihydroxypyridine 3-monooxygenase
MTPSRPRAVVIGGSIGGLTTALRLREVGFEVDIFERTGTYLDGRGSGIVLQPETVRWVVERHSDVRLGDVSTASRWLRYLDPDGGIEHEEQVTWRFTSWTTFYRVLLDDFGRDRYHLGEFAVGIEQSEDSATVRFASGRVAEADLVVFADGVMSTGRRRLMPEVAFEYSGYVGWRGTVPENDLSAATHALLADALSYSVAPHTQICMYPIPGPNGEVDEGRRVLNYVWYRNVAAGPELDELMTDSAGFSSPISLHPGRVQQRFVDEMRETARRVLAPAAAELVGATEQPYLQVVVDVRSTRMAFGRIAILGDAAFAARPHAAAGTAKAAADAWALAAALEDSKGDVPAALKAWEVDQLRVGESLVNRARAMGSRSQFTCDWDPRDPALHFGLYGPDQ